MNIASLNFIDSRVVLAALGLFLCGFFLSSFLWRFVFLRNYKKKFRKASRSVIKGLVNEQLTPYLPGFKYNPSEVKFLGNPVDLIVFKGLDSNRVTEIVFLEIKSGKQAKLSAVERSIRDVINEKRVVWQMYRTDR